MIAADPHVLSADALFAAERGLWKPPPRLTLSEWADEHFRLSAESSAEVGRWRTLPYQRAIMDAFTDPAVTRISVMKSARVGYTKVLDAAIGYHIHHAPCGIMVVQPTVDDAKGFSKEEIAPMLRDCPELARIVFEEAEEKIGPKDSANTILHKALALDTPVPTPTGWTTIGQIQPGDEVFDAAGQPTTVTAVTPVFLDRPCFRVRFSDGGEIVADSDHGWAVEWWRVKAVDGIPTQTLQAGVLMTAQIAPRVRNGGRCRYAVRNTAPLVLPAANLPLDPYVLGAWLGDGFSHRAYIGLGHEDAHELAGYLAACGHTVTLRKTTRVTIIQLDSAPARRGTDGRMVQATSGALAALRVLGVLGTIGDSRKHIPALYLRASSEQRRALLQGLMDTDGHVRAKDGLCVLTTSSPLLADAYQDLLSGLGVKWKRVAISATYTYKDKKHTSPRAAYRFEFHPPFPAFRLKRKRARQKEAGLRSIRRRIVSVEPVDSVPVKCITVNTQQHLFLAGSGMVPTHNCFPGGVLSLAGANSGTGFRRISRKIVLLDEIDAYPLSAGSDGDPVELAAKRSEYFWDRKIVAGSTPLLEGISRIKQLFLDGDQRRFYVPCPHCEHMDYFVFQKPKDGKGHWLEFDEAEPDFAHMVCSGCGAAIEHQHKRCMIERGEWRAAKPFAGHASFHIWAAYSFSPNATWADLAKKWIKVHKIPDQLKTFVNTDLGETWAEQGDAPDWERIYQRREDYPLGVVPAGVLALTAGVDVQHTGWFYEVTGWGANKHSWVVEAGFIPGDPSNEADWTKVDDRLLNASWPTADGGRMVVRMLAVDSGDQTQSVYNWTQRHPLDRVIAVKGADARVLIGAPSDVVVKSDGKKWKRGQKLWIVGSGIAKSELYGLLKLPIPRDGQALPIGWCHFSDQLGEDYFKGLTSEQLVTARHPKTGQTIRAWHVIPGRANHFLDARVYSRAAASLIGLDLMRTELPTPPAEPVQPAQIPIKSPPPPAQSKWLGGNSQIRDKGGGWLKRRR